MNGKQIGLLHEHAHRALPEQRKMEEVHVTLADRWEFTVNEEEPQRIFTVIPGLDPQERSQIKPGDRVELEVVGTRLVTDVTGVDEDFRGVVRDVTPDLSAQLGLTAGEEISFRFAHIFFIDHL